MHEVSLEEVLEQILAADSRYHRDAYFFVKDALDHTQRLVTKSALGKVRHVSGQELLDGIREYSLTQFGPMVITVFEEWGIYSCRDFGEIVFNMVEHKLLAKTERDSREDFVNGYGFDDAFRKPFLPASKQAVTEKPAAP
jgi:uncharacterized repeat protein (TIGR04138 family)